MSSAQIRKYWRVYRMGLQETISDAGKAWIWYAMLMTQAFVFAYTWLIVAGGRDTIGSLPTGEVIAYYFYMFVGWFVVGGYFHFGMGEAIRQGTLSVQLSKPLLPFTREILSEQGWKTLGLIFAIPLLGLMVLLFAGKVELSLDPLRFLMCIPALILGGLTFGLVDFMIGLAGFWLERVDGIRGVIMACNNILGGYFLPIALLPLALQQAAFWLPFRYGFSFSIEIFQGLVTGDQIWQGYLLQLFWLLVLFLLARFLLKRGLRRYESYGG